MNKIKRNVISYRHSLALLFLVFIVIQAPVKAESNILFILDASNSMWGQIDGEAKVTSAQNVLIELLADLPSETNVGLVTYGHRKESECSDIEVLSNIGEDSSDSLASKITSIKPKGKTPIAASLDESLNVLSKFEGANNHVVLISDGVETCDGDPCAAAKRLADAGVDARVHVVGFDIGEEERKQLECIPGMGNGKYFSASNATELKNAVQEVKKVAEAPPAPEPVLYFEDNFDGEELADHWELINPDPDSYIVEDGALTIIFSSDLPIAGSEELPNIFKLTKELPEGDWIATMRVIVTEVSTFRERYVLGLYDDQDNMLTATAGIENICCTNTFVNLWGDKVSKGKTTSLKTTGLKSYFINHGGLRSHGQEFLKGARDNIKAIYIRLKKSGRSYVASVKVEGDLTTADGAEPQWVELQKLSSLRAPGNSLIATFRQEKFTHPGYNIEGGESISSIDWIKIEKL